LLTARRICSILIPLPEFHGHSPWMNPALARKGWMNGGAGRRPTGANKKGLTGLCLWGSSIKTLGGIQHA